MTLVIIAYCRFLVNYNSNRKLSKNNNKQDRTPVRSQNVVRVRTASRVGGLDRSVSFPTPSQGVTPSAAPLLQQALFRHVFSSENVNLSESSTCRVPAHRRRRMWRIWVVYDGDVRYNRRLLPLLRAVRISVPVRHQRKAGRGRPVGGIFRVGTAPRDLHHFWTSSERLGSGGESRV